MRLLDLFCGAGGAAMGYSRAGFDEIVGVDISEQRHYPFRFVRGDALQVLGWMKTHGGRFPIDHPDRRREWLGPFDVVHASPPCQGYSQLSVSRPELAGTYPKLIADVRHGLQQLDIVTVIENVVGAKRSMQQPILLCGAMFGRPMYRHRLFESNVPLATPAHPKHSTKTSRAGHWREGTFVCVAGNCAPIELARDAMQIDWTNRHGLKEAIPPVFTEYIGKQLLAHLRSQQERTA